MYLKTTLIVFLFSLLFISVAFPATIVVTSNADLGPGTLRAALTTAANNGVTDQDIITFNLPGSLTSDRIIRLKTQLPLITANVVIDGTTQPGSAFGISDSKVIIEPETPPAYFSGLVIAGDYSTANITQGVEIYGLYIRNFAKITNLVNYDASQGSGIYIQGNASGIKIGAPGKGNVICGNVNGVYNAVNYSYNYNSGDITIQSNIIGLSDDGTTPISNINGISINSFTTNTIGGDQANMGNTISACASGITITRSTYYYNTLQQTISIKNNKIGTDYSGAVDYKQSPIFLASSFLKTYGININSVNTNVDISANLISGQIGYGVFIGASTYSITNNKIGTDITGTQNLGNYEGIRSDASAKGTIGGAGANDKNYIGFNTYGIEVYNSNQVNITQNSIFCNNNLGISVSSSYYQPPFVQILTFLSDKVAGIATPNSAIELFYSDDCGNVNCQGKEYLATVQSDGSGKWSYSGTISHTVVATATNSSKNTSPFSSLNLRDNEAVLKNYTCAYNGSITIPQQRDGILFHWDKKEPSGTTLTPLSDTQNIDNLQPGTYVLTIQYPGGCQKVTQRFTINDQRIKIQKINEPVPRCRQKSFPVSVNYTGGTGNIQFKWVNDQNVVVSSGISTNVPGGKYVLHITDDAGCDVTSDPITIVPLPGPEFDLSRRGGKNAHCGEKDGAITGIIATPGVGQLRYSWTNNKNEEIATTLDLTGVPSGYYTLTLNDDSQCSGWSTGPLYVGEDLSVFIGEANITPVTCDASNGAINVPKGNITNASKFSWFKDGGPELVQYRDKLILTGLSPGNYTLHAVNPITTCPNDRTYTVPRIPPDVFSASYTKADVTCGLGNNGSITVNFNTNTTPATFTWTNESGQIVGTTKDIAKAIPGKYTLTVTDRVAGCTSVLFKDIEVLDIPLLAFDPSNNNPSTQNDQCDQQMGSITGIVVTGGVPPYTYHWTDGDGKTVGSNTASLTSIGAGTYHLTVTDATPCGLIAETTYQVGNDKYIPPAPILSNQQICTAGPVTLYVKNVQPQGLYKLYEHYDDVVPVQTNSSGQFNVDVKQSGDYFVSFNIGSCESYRFKVHVEVILVDINFANTITPNGDGLNDYWKITGLEKFPGATVQVFNRFGKLMFDSIDYPKPFDGTLKGKPLPTGVYYYIINIHMPCNLISGNLTLVR